ncbi:hypothetical protein GC105_16390 [Alkalibaculum sp. M08DMB]|uniref:Zinc ribbon domain-containing protein n=1 Tax=Alkalibaculum sporogenes TaxID=2655001 RepID=A0A6A7KDB1_9FIRM|nr:hypothetical protein [Alkalibaculum sporogenes]MPW27345.1 hypothetical protein [Alkalibaculum sporogenes]
MRKTVLKSTNCKNCGGQMKFDPKTQQTVCSGCSSTMEDPREQKEELSCPNCGAVLAIVKGTSQTECKSCDSVFSIVQDDDSGDQKEISENHKFIDPFNIPQDEYQKGMISWLANTKGVPTDVFDKIAIIAFEGRYVPYYYCTVDYKMQWSASIGHEREETYTDYVKKTTKGRTRMVPVTKSRTVTDWSPHSSSSTGRINLVCEASDYFKNAKDKIMGANKKKNEKKIIGSFDSFYIDENFKNIVYGNTATKIEKLDVKYTAGFKLIPFEEPVSKVYDKTKINNEIYARIKKDAPGDRIKNISFNGDIDNEYYVIYRPYWITKYSYDDTAYLNICDGNNAASHIGNTPIDKNQKLKFKKMFLPFKISLGVMIIFAIIAGILGEPAEGADVTQSSYSLFIGLSSLSFVVAGIFGIVGMIRRNGALNKSKDIVVKQASNYLNNSKTIFDRKSAITDPVD